MAKGYWVARADVHNEEAYKPYVATNTAILRKFGGRIVMRAGKFECVEGTSRSRNVVFEFADYAAALACFRSPEYQANIKVRLAHANVDFIVVEGYDGPQPPQPPQPASPPPAAARKGHWIGRIDVTEPEGYKAYMAADMAPLGKFGGRFLVRGGTYELIEGQVRSRSVVLEFPSYAAALACYRSPDYQAAKKLREGNADFDLIIVEGYDGPQP
jgi:uncharacterized protein (DUF1330 family)